mgnify:FL=1|jgi:hypothetical protein
MLLDADWALKIAEHQRNGTVATVAILAIVALSFRRFYRVVRAIAKTVPLAKGVPIRGKYLRAWY